TLRLLEGDRRGSNAVHAGRPCATPPVRTEDRTCRRPFWPAAVFVIAPLLSSSPANLRSIFEWRNRYGRRPHPMLGGGLLKFFCSDHPTGNRKGREKHLPPQPHFISYSWLSTIHWRAAFHLHGAVMDFRNVP